MSETRHAARLGFGRKLYSAKGTLLGTVNYPYHWDEVIQERGGGRFQIPRPLRFTMPQDLAAEMLESMRTFLILPCRRDRGGVEIHGISLEEFEKIEGCAFQPGAGYLRSLVE